MLKPERLILIALLVVISSYACLALYFIHGLHYLPVHEDETIFYKSALFFYEHNSVAGESCIDEKFSVIFSANWYGIAYNLFYGSIAKLIGFNNVYFVFLNFILVGITCFLLSRINTPGQNKIAMLLCFFSFNMVFAYSFTYFPEVLNIFFGCCLVFLLLKIYEREKESLHYKTVVFYILLTLFFSFFRLTWIFWLVALLPFSRNRKEFITYSSVFLTGMFIAVLFLQFCCAPYFSVYGNILGELKQLHIVGFIKGFSVNICRNLYYFFYLQFFVDWSWMLVKLFYLVMVGHACSILWKRENKLLMSVALVLLLNFFVLFSLYSAVYPYFMKITASLFLVYVITIIYMDMTVLKNSVILILMISFPMVLKFTVLQIKLRKSAYIESVTTLKKQIEELKSIAQFAIPGKENIIQGCWYDLTSPSNTTFECSLPVTTPDGFPIRYTFNIYNRKVGEEINYRTFNRLHIDFVLSGKELHLQDVSLIHKYEHFYFYKKLYD